MLVNIFIQNFKYMGEIDIKKPVSKLALCSCGSISYLISSLDSSRIFLVCCNQISGYPPKLINERTLVIGR